jgi:hypothetical protein
VVLVQVPVGVIVAVVVIRVVVMGMVVRMAVGIPIKNLLAEFTHIAVHGQGGTVGFLFSLA